jgi:hypothetical protein
LPGANRQKWQRTDFRRKELPILADFRALDS